MSGIVSPSYPQRPARSGWRLLKLKQLCIGGPVYGENIPADEYAAEGLRFIRTTDIDDAGHLSAEGVYVQSVAPEIRLKDGDLLLSRSGTIGRSFLYRSAIYGPCAHAGYLVRFRPKDRHTGRFLFWVTKSLPFLAQLASDAIESTIANFNGQRYANLALLCPSGEEQRAIADFLDRETAKIDALIATQERLIALLDEKRQATITHAVTKGLDPNAPMKESGVEWIGIVPKNWTVKNLKYLTSIASGYAPSDSFNREGGRYPVYGSNGIIGYCNEYFVRRETLVVGRVGASGVVNTVPAESWVSDNALLLRIVWPETHLKWLRYVLETLNLGTQDSKTAQPLITGTFLGGQLIPTPDLREQCAIAEFLDRNTASIDGLRHKSGQIIERLRERRAALITAAVTGQIDVSRSAITEAAE